jgi:glucose dehydrogenase
MKTRLALLATLRAVCFAADGDDHTIPAARPDELTPANGWPALDHYRDWSRSLGGPTSHRFSTLDQITRDKKIRAFSAETGVELWAAVLPLHGTAPPTNYEVDGRQFVVIAATGGGKLGGRTGDAWVAFALPKPK